MGKHLKTSRATGGTERLACGSRSLLSGLIAVVAAVVASIAPAMAQEEKRLGLVIGNSEYVGGPLATSANDAGLIAQTLQAAGFDVMGARDLDGDALRNTFRDFVDKVAAEGPGSVVFVYLAGHGVQYEGENYFVPVDAKIERDVDVPIRALRISDYVRPLGALKAKAVIVVLDAARDAPFAKAGQPLAGGLSLIEPAGGMMWAFNAAPGTIATPGNPPYGPYAQALAEMMREGGQRVEAVFDRVRLRVHDATSGAEVPWHASQLKTPVVFFERAADAPTEVSFTAAQTRRERPIQAFDDAREAYLAALERDTLQGYLDFLRAYPDHALAKRVRAIVAARREAITWRRTRNADTPEAYWSYLDRYPNGPHAHDARRRLAFLTAPPEPPPRYVAYDYDIPPPPPEEIIFVRRPYVYFADPVYAFIAPPPPPIFFLPPPPPVYYFAPPPPPIAVFVLPVPVFVPMPIYVRHPVYVRPPPPTNVVYRNIHAPVQQPPNFAGPMPKDGPVPKGPLQGDPSLGPNAPKPGVSAGTIAAGAAVVGAGAAAAAVALPPSVQKRATTMPQPGPGTAPAGVTKTGVPVQPGTAPLPGVTGGPQLKGTQPPQPGAGAGAVVPPTARPLPGATTGTPLPPVPGKGPPGIATPPTPGPVVTPKGPTAPPPSGGQPDTKSVTVRPQGPGGTPPGPGTGGPPGPRTVTVPPPVQGAGPGQVAPRQQRIDRAQEDRAAVQQKLQQDRQRDLERRRQEQDAQRNARQQNQLQDLQRQRQQQMEGQRKAMEQQRAQQAQQQQMMRQQQAQQQQAAQAAARAQAEAAARARAAQQQQQQKRPPCGAPGLPPCPR